MNLKEVFTSKWLKGDDIEDPRTVTIENVTIEEFDNRDRPGQKDKKVALHFRGEDQGMICNVGMRNIVMGFYGPDTDDWIGKKIRIMSVPFTNDKGDTSMVCRIHPKKPDATPPKPAAPKPPVSDNDGAGPELPDDF